MSNVTRYDPFQEFSRLGPFHEADGFFNLPWLRKMVRDLPAEPTIKLDVAEDEKAYTVKAEMPGVKKEDIDVQVEGARVSLAAEVKREKEQKKGETVVHTERYVGKQYRSFMLGQDIDPAGVQARFEDGVLSLTLPKAGNGSKKKIAVQ
jgi:HSP20 family protein